jgi:methionyl-tRNA formyltransferase
MVRDLAALRPDVVVLARCRMLEAPVLRVAREGTVNVHPGLLPWIRGNSPAGHSLLRGIPLGVTSYRVDEGIDTGAIIERRLVAVPGDGSLDELKGALHRAWVDLTVDLIETVRREGIPSGRPQPRRHPLCRTLSDPEQLAAVRAAALRGDARRLFLRFRPLCRDDLSLPSDIEPSFGEV